MNLIAGGFLIAKTVPRAEWMPGELLPPHICSASDCISPQFPSSRVIEWTQDTKEERQRYFKEIGILASREAEAIQWGTENFEKLYGWPGVFYDLNSARSMHQEFFVNNKNISIIGLGLSEEFVDDFMKEVAPPSGYLDVIKKMEVMPKDGELLSGFYSL